MFSVRIITADHYMSAPLSGFDVIYSNFRGSNVKQVPVIRIFGSTPGGRKVCLHVHGVFPYIYIPYDGSESKDSESYRLSSSLDKAINVSLGKSNSTTQHVYKISLVSGRPFYGYHEKEHQFFKIFLYNPIMVKRAADLLQSGAVLNKSFQPHEAHINFILQFFIDFNLYGMNFINLSKVNYRQPIAKSDAIADNVQNRSTSNVGIPSFDHVPEELYLPESVPRMSTCELELDAIASAIINISTVSEKMTLIPGLAALWEEERERRRMHGLSSQLTPALSQPRNNSVFTKSELHYTEKMHSQFLECKVSTSSPITLANESVLESSSYPSETPENADLQNASLVEVQLPTSLNYGHNEISYPLSVQSSPEKNEKCHASQNSILLDSQDQILVDALEEMLKEKYEDSILGSQPPLNDNTGLDDFMDKTAQEEVEDNHLLEMSQVFDWEEKTEDKCLKRNLKHTVCIEGENTVKKSLNDNAEIVSNIAAEEISEKGDLAGGETEDIPNAAVELNGKVVQSTNVKEVLNDDAVDSSNTHNKLQIHDKSELITGLPEQKELKSNNEGGSYDALDWEDSFRCDEDEGSFEEPIAQLDGVDDIIGQNVKVVRKGVTEISKQRWRLGVGRRLSGVSQKETTSAQTSVLPPIPEASSVTGKVENIPCSEGQPSNNNCNVSNFPKRKLSVEIEEFKPQVPIVMAKHRRVHELKSMSRLSVSKTKEKVPSNLTLHNQEKPLYISKTDNNKEEDMKSLLQGHDSQINYRYNMRRKNFASMNTSVKYRKEISIVPHPANPVPLLKTCTVRLELIDEYSLCYLCRKHGVVLSSSSLKLLNAIEKKHEEMEANQHLQKNSNQCSGKETNQHSSEDINQIPCGKHIIDTGRDRPENQEGVFHSTGSNTSKHNTFSYSELTETKNSKKNRNNSGCIFKDNSFSEISCQSPTKSHSSGSMSSNKVNTKRIETNKSSPKTPKKQKLKVACDKKYYRPLNVLLQKSPVQSKNKEIHEGVKKSSITSDGLQSGVTVKEAVRKCDSHEICFSKSNDHEEYLIEDVDETKELRYKPLEMVTTSLPPCKESCVSESIKLQNSYSNECMLGTTSGNTNNIKVRKRLEFSQDSSEAESFTCHNKSDHDYESQSRKSHSESSCDEDGLGIMSFCDDDVFNSCVLTPSLAEKSVRRSTISISPRRSQKGDFSERENKLYVAKSENYALKNAGNASPTNDTLLPALISDYTDSTEIDDSNEVCEFNYGDAGDDNGIEYAPLLKSPSWEIVAKYKYDQEPTGLPYCSDPDDIPSKPMEVGELVLRLYSNRPNSLPPFESCFGISGLKDHRRRVLENTFGGTDELEVGNQWEKISKAALLPDAGSREVVITPCMYPPKYRDVSQWIIDRGYDNAQKKDCEVTPCSREKRKLKLVVGCPLEAGDDDEDLEVISLSPCSISSSQEVSDRRRSFIVQSTPHSLLKSSKLHNEIPNPNNNCLTLSPIQAVTDEEEIIMCTPPPIHESENSFDKRKLKKKLHRLSLNRKRLLGKNSCEKNLLKSIREEDANFCPKNISDDESNVPEKLKRFEENQLKSPKEIPLKNYQHLVGLGGSGHSSCQIDGISPNNTFGFQNSPNNLQNAKAIVQPEHVTVMTMEVHVKTRGDFRPDPEYDPIQAIFYSFMEDGGNQMEKNANKETGILLVDATSNNTSHLLKNTGVTLKCVKTACDETSLLKILGEIMKKWDPDILAGYEVEMQSWGYLLERGRHLGLDVKSLLSRVSAHSYSGVYGNKANEPAEIDSKRIKDFEDYDPIKLPGRIVLNVWRLMRNEVALMSYTFENVMYHLLHERVPLHSFKSLHNWWEHRSHLFRWITVEHWIVRVEGVMRLLFQLDLISRTSELARLFGIQFYEVLSRGSQFRVESIMLRFAKPLNYISVSPNSQQRAGMRAPEQLPLIMEPESRFFEDPVIVLDFQSLYPSIIIAYNYCFSTCLGRVNLLGQTTPFKFGCTNLLVPPEQIAKLLNKQKKFSAENDEKSRAVVSFSPCGVGFVGKEVKEGILPRMLSQILETRLMVKKALKENKGNRVVERVLNSRQLGLKLIANVTYGYTSANFSGRMPCIEVGDSVVSKGRETLERAIALVHEKWGSQGVRVVYGDTDSLFVLAKGFSQAEAFKLGAKIAELVTESNPSPIKLKLEKIFQPCILQTKKRYVGYAYESPGQEKPIFDAKGIETVRRDGCPAVAKVLEKSLRILFDTRDVSLVKLHVQRQLGKLLSGRLSLQELTFAREYRGAAGYRPGACVPALQLARRWVSIDRRAEPRSGERVPYVIVSGPPGLPLFQLVRSPHELLMLNMQASTSTGVTTQPQMHINAHYYITRVIVPPLQRCFSLIGVDVESWYVDMPHKFRSMLQPLALLGPVTGNDGLRNPDFIKETHAGTSVGHKRSTISEYFATSDCLSCGSQLEPGAQGLCAPCMKNPQKTAFILVGRCNAWDRAFSYISKICQSCCQRMDPIECTSLDCPVLYRKHQAMLEAEQATTLRIVLNKMTW